MKNLMRKNLLWSNLTLKCCSFILGFGLWSFLSQSQLRQKQFQIPVCFFGNSTMNIKSTTMVEVILEAQRSLLSSFDKNALAVHINNENLQSGKNNYIINQEDLFLPSSINMVHCNPRILDIMVNTPEEHNE